MLLQNIVCEKSVVVWALYGLGRSPLSTYVLCLFYIPLLAHVELMYSRDFGDINWSAVIQLLYSFIHVVNKTDY